MNKITISLLVVASIVAYSSAAVRPQSKLYFSIPLGPAPAAPPAAPPAEPAAEPAAEPPPADEEAPPEGEDPPPEGEDPPPEGEEPPPEGEEPPAEPAAEEPAPAPAAEPAQMQLSIIPLGQLLGMILSAFFGTALPGPLFG